MAKAKAETRAGRGQGNKAKDRASELKKRADYNRWVFSVELSDALQVQATRVSYQLSSEVERVKMSTLVYGILFPHALTNFSLLLSQGICGNPDSFSAKEA